MLKSTLILVPVYNCEKSLALLLEQLPIEHTLVIDDGSSDASMDIIKRMNFTCLSHAENLGVGAALKTGVKYALSEGYEYCITLDGDGQHNPIFISDFFEAVQENDFVIGNRFSNVEYVPGVKLAANFLASYIVNNVLGKKLFDVTCGFRAFPVTASILDIADNGYGFLHAHLMSVIKSGAKISSVDVDCIYPIEKLFSSPKVEITGFIDAILPFLEDEQSVTKLKAIRTCFNTSQNFTFDYEGVPISAFYLQDYKSFLIQMDRRMISDYYEDVSVESFTTLDV